MEEEQHFRPPSFGTHQSICKAIELEQCVSKFEVHTITSSTTTKYSNLESVGLKTKQLSRTVKSIDQKITVDKLINQTASNSKVESMFTQTKPLTNISNTLKS